MTVRRFVLVVQVNSDGYAAVSTCTSDVLFLDGEQETLRAEAESVDEIFLSAHGCLDLEVGRAKRWLEINSAGG